GAACVVQDPPLGTGDAVRVGLQAFEQLPQRLLVAGGDTPLIATDTVRAVLEAVPAAAIAITTAEVPDAHGYGRVILGSNGRVERIIEEADATPDERANRLVMGWPIAFDGSWLVGALPRLRPSASG